MLWFAQNSLPLWWQRQPNCQYWRHFSRCDLLKIHYLCGDKDNWCAFPVQNGLVVICSKFITFVVTKTTSEQKCHYTGKLWFAQNSLPLWWQRQLTTIRKAIVEGCDLLKIHYLCGDKDNVPTSIRRQARVVICSKFITFVVTKTTVRR